ncbi:MAG: hypothetical protein JXR38_00025 [Bacilli bacterium]|nr:hypothetical protein [Bacilli bacterium]
MRCQICNRFYAVELTFESLLSAKEICPLCRELIAIPVMKEVIPYRNGEIHYHYLSDLPNCDLATMQRFEKMIVKALKEAISDYDQDSIMIFLDEREYGTFACWSQMLFSYQKAIFISTVRYDFMKYDEHF